MLAASFLEQRSAIWILNVEISIRLFATQANFCEKRGWKVITQQALSYTEEGKAKSYWEKMWSVKYLLKLQEQDRIAFSYQYLNQ